MPMGIAPPETQQEVLKRWPSLAAHCICESLGYWTPDGAALALLQYKRGEPYHCEWYWAMNRYEQGRPLGEEFDRDLLDVNRQVIQKAISRRHDHKGYMAEYKRALTIVKRQTDSGERPMLASWF